MAKGAGFLHTAQIDHHNKQHEADGNRYAPRIEASKAEVI